MSVHEDRLKLEALGYGQYFEADRLHIGASLACVARVTAEHRGAYDIIGLSGEHRAMVSGKYSLDAHSRTEYPAVGDWVVTKDNAEQIKTIDHTLARRSLLKKKYSSKEEEQLIAANVDVAFIVESMDRDYSVNRFERYIVLAYEGGVEPVIVLNKTDLITETVLQSRIEQLNNRFPNIQVLAMSSLSGTAHDTLSGYIKPGQTYCFLGSSGVGKSTIIGKLLNTTIKTKNIGEKTGRGKHTTTAREMYFTGNGAIIIDNPGSRAVGIVNFGDGSRKLFFDIENLANECKYKDCSHTSEPNCAVLAALNTGKIDSSQYDNFMKLQNEAKHYNKSSLEKRQKDKQFGKFIKHAKADISKYKSR